ncbi:MAG TPA: beta-propeller fold lactonase family protein [Candidatus Angelobacter sp.]
MTKILAHVYGVKWRLMAAIGLGLMWVLGLLSPARAVAQNLNAYVTNFAGNTVSVINTNNHRVVATIAGFNGPDGVAMTPNGRKVYVANGGPTPGTVSVIRTGRNRVRRRITVGNNPTGVAVSPNGRRVYVTNQNDGTLSVIDATRDRVIATILLGGAPLGMAVTPDSQHVYIAVYPSMVAVLTTATNKVTATIVDPSLSGPALVAMSPDGKTVYVSDMISNKITVISTATNLATGSIPVGQIPLGLALTADGKKLYAANGADSTVSVIDTTTQKVIKTLSGFNGPEGVVLAPDGNNIWVANTVSNTVSVISVASDTVTANVAVGQMPVILGLLTPAACTALNGGIPCP